MRKTRMLAVGMMCGLLAACGQGETPEQGSATGGATAAGQAAADSTAKDPRVTVSAVAVAKNTLPTFSASLEPLPGAPPRLQTTGTTTCDPAKQTCPVTSSTSSGSGSCDPAKETCPVTSVNAGGGTAPPAPNFYDEIYKFIGDPVPAGKEDEWGIENLYNNIAEGDYIALGGSRGGGMFYQPGMTDTCGTEINKAVPSPFDFGVPAGTYECAKNEHVNLGSGLEFNIGLAWKKEADKTSLLFTTEEPGKRGGDVHTIVGRSVYVKSTGEMENDFAGFAPPATGEDNNYTLRSEVRGNAVQHTFTFRATRGAGTLAGALDESGTKKLIEIVGKGVSRGAGNYFLLRVRDRGLDGSMKGQGPREKYYCVTSTATLEEFKKVVGTDLSGVAPNCSVYKSDVSAMAYFKSGEVPLKPFSWKLEF